MTNHLKNEELKHKIDLYVDGQLSPREVDELWAELIQKERYMDYMKSVANLKTVVAKRSKETQQVSREPYIYYAAAAVVALLIAVIGVINFAIQSSEQSISPVADVELQYYRSADGALASEEGEDAIRDAIVLSNQGNTTQAINMLKAELDDKEISPDRQVELTLTLGSLYYNRDQYDNAIQSYSSIINLKDQHKVGVLALEKAYWYRGNAYFQKDQFSKAKADFQKTYELNGAYRRLSERYLDAF